MEFKNTEQVMLFAGKLNNRQDPMRLGKIMPDAAKVVTSLVTANNVNIGNNGEITKRKGRTQKLDAPCHSLWIHPQDDSIAYYVNASSLYRLNADYTGTLVASLANNRQMAYEVINGEIVATNGEEIGWLSGTTYDLFAPSLGQFEAATPAGQYLSYMRGVLYVARGNIIYASKPHNIEVMDERFCMFPMDGYLRMLAAVEDGLWVGTKSQVGFISGKGTDEFDYTPRTFYGPPDGAFHVQTEEDGAKVNRIITWVSREGFCRGLQGGNYENLSKPDITLPDGETGHVFSAFTNGIRQYIAVIHGPEYTRSFIAPPIDVNETTL